MTKITIVAAILDTVQLTLYKENGDTVQLKQGDPRIKSILEQSQPLVRQRTVEVNLMEELAPPAEPHRNDYKEFEEQTSGTIKFFRVAKNAVRKFFGGGQTETYNNGNYGIDEFIAPMNLGVVPTSDINPKVQDATPNQKPTMEAATAEIMAQAKPVSAPDYNHADTSTEETMVAQVTDAEGKTALVPGMENLQAQFRHAAKLGTTEGVTNFLKRIAAIISDRGHTIDELLNFMSRGDLPIADDGSIVAYKVLQSRENGYFVDCHSKAVKQRVGSYVKQHNVDRNRRTECSTGLHIARRGYLGNFSGDVIVLVKVAPEDVIAVPLNEPDKMRAQGYHILSEIPKNEHQKLRANGPIEGSEAKKLLTQALRGKHIAIIEDVVIGGPRGSGVVVTPRPGYQPDQVVEAPKVPRNTPKAETVAPVIPPEPKKQKLDAPKVDPKQVAAKANKAKAETRQERIDRLINVVRGNAKLPERMVAAEELQSIKSGAKKSWDSLGISSSTVATIQQMLDGATTGPAAKAEPVKKVPDLKVETEAEAATRDRAKKDPNAHLKATAEAGKRMADAKRNVKDLPVIDVDELATTGNVVKKAPAPKKKAAPIKAPAKLKEEAKVIEEQLLAQAKRAIEDVLASTSLNRNQKAASLVNMLNNSTFIMPVKKEAYRALIEFKRKAKVGWGQLGVDNFDALQAKFEGK